MPNNIDSVTAWAQLRCVQLSARRALDFRVLPAGTYSHVAGLFPSCREGITDGVHAILWTGERVIEIAHSNLLVTLDVRYVSRYDKPRTAKRERTATAKPRAARSLNAKQLTDILLAL